MAIDVNPPPQLRIPKAFLQDREVRAFIEQQNVILFQLWNRTGGVNDFISEVQDSSIIGSSSLIQDLQKRVGFGLFFTIDTSGFTVDTSLLTTDKAAI